jgi:DNA-binding NtrC family response regulator
MDEHLAELFGATTIEIPALRTRADDLPALIRHALDGMAAARRHASASVDPAALSVLLAHSWPGNTRELSGVLQKALLAAGDGPIQVAHLPALLPSASSGRAGFASERDWILDGLRRNRFRRGETARFLGVSRKTLYNRMVALGLLSPQGGRGH